MSRKKWVAGERLDASDLNNAFMFGGDGSDGVLNITSGTTTLDASGANIIVKNYSSVSITGTAKLTISNPAANGTILILKSQGDVIITSSTVPAIDMKGMGADGGASDGGAGNVGTQGFQIFNDTQHYGSGGTLGTPGIGGVAPSAFDTFTKHWYSITITGLQKKIMYLAVGSGGAAGAQGSGSSNEGAGGKGGGSLYIECGGALNITSTVDVSGNDGGDASRTSGSGAGGGGGGAAGMILIVYNTLTDDSGTYTASGGDGGDGSTGTGGSPNAGGGSGASNYSSQGGDGGEDGDLNGKNGGVGSGAGGGGGGASGAGGTGGTSSSDSDLSLVIQNNIW